MNRTKSTLLVTAVFLSAVGCKKSHEVNRAAYIVGPTNDIKKMGESERKEIPASVYHASVLIATQLADKKVRFCSGTLIQPASSGANLRVLTNHHCFAKQDGDGKAINELLIEACSFTKAYFGYYAGNAAEATSVSCEPGTLQTNFNGDLAVFTLSMNPPSPYGALPFWDGDTVPEGRKAYIVHYPDVAENLEAANASAVSLPVAAVTVQDCKVTGLFDSSEWDLDRTLPYSLRHTCDLIHGSSGSALVDAQTSSMIGVNWGGIKIAYKSGTRIDNVATRIDYVKAFLDGRTDSFVVNRSPQGVGSSNDAVAGTVPQNSSDEASSAKSTPKKKKSLCGVIAGTSSDTSHDLEIILSFLFLPIIVLNVPRLLKQRG